LANRDANQRIPVDTHPSVEPDADAVGDGEVVHVEPDDGARSRLSPHIGCSRQGRGRRRARFQSEPPLSTGMCVDMAQGAGEPDGGRAGRDGGGGRERHVDW
jgi:hypothetical protein